jgi:hypothetical protein
MGHFYENDILPALKLITISNITSYTLIETISKCKSFYYRYEVFKYLLPYISTFDSFDHKIKIIELFGHYDYNDITVPKEAYKMINCISDSITSINVVENYDTNLNPPPRYETIYNIQFVSEGKFKGYFNDNIVLPLLKLVKISNITSGILIIVLSKCQSLNRRYEIFNYLIPYIHIFDSLEHKMKIIKLFEHCIHYEHENNLQDVINRIKDIKLVEKCEENLNHPPPYNIANNIPCEPVQNRDNIQCLAVQNKDNISCIPVQNKDNILCTSVQNKDNKQTVCCILL